MTEKRINRELATKAIEDFKSAAVEIVNLFCEKHEFTARYDERDIYFVDRFCDTCMIGDYAFQMQTMIESLDGDLPAGELLQWYDYTLNYVQIFGSMDGCPNFMSWCKGCPRVDLLPIMEKKEELDEMIRKAKREKLPLH